MMYGTHCPTCNYAEDVRMPWQEYSEDRFPVCPNCNKKLIRTWRDTARLDHQSKGKFGFVTQNMGDGPQYVHDHGDMQRKLKARGLHLAEPNTELTYRHKHMKDLP